MSLVGLYRRMEEGEEIRLVVEGLGEFLVFPGILYRMETRTQESAIIPPSCDDWMLNIPFFLRCHGVYCVLSEEMVVPSTRSHGKDSGSGTGGIESSWRSCSFRASLRSRRGCGSLG